MAINTELKDMTEEALQRSSIYGFLARVYRKELTPDMLAQIKAPDFKEVLSDMKAKLGDEFFSEPDDKLIEDLAEEYTRLFLGPGTYLLMSRFITKEMTATGAVSGAPLLLR